LDTNLQAQAESEALYDKICWQKSETVWAPAEKNRSLGYSGNSKRTQERERAKSRARKAAKIVAKTS
jgi:hypothetical protein